MRNVLPVEIPTNLAMMSVATAAVKPSVLVKLRAYLALTKPRIIQTLLITTVPPMFVAQGGVPGIGLVFWTVLGGALAAGGANAVNMWYDRDIDAVMKRTTKRPLVVGVMTPQAALWFAVGLLIAAFVVFAVWVNLLSGVISIAAACFYIFVYTMWLKRSSTSNIVIGGAAGSAPALVGWSAVRDEISLASFLMFVIVFLWTPPHFWALAMKYRGDYEAARVPMMPVVRSASYTTLNILVYTLAVTAVSLALGPVAQLGVLYGLTAIFGGAVFIGLALALHRDPTDAKAMRVFHWSITYITLVFCAMAIDQFVRLA